MGALVDMFHVRINNGAGIGLSVISLVSYSPDGYHLVEGTQMIRPDEDVEPNWRIATPVDLEPLVAQGRDGA